MKFEWYGKLDRNSRLAFWTSFSGYSLDAMDVQLYAFLIPVLAALWKLSPSESGFLASLALVASAAGGWIAGALADRYGRVRLLRITILWLAISTLFCGLADNFDQLCIARALQGLGFGGELAVGAVFIAEIAIPEFRAGIAGTAQSAWPLGWGLAAASSALFLSLLPEDYGWRATFLVAVFPAIAIFLMRTRLKEPEVFLKSRSAVRRSHIFSARLLPATLRGSLLASGIHGSYWAIATWWPAMLKTERGLSPSDAALYFGALVAGSMPGYVFGAWAGDQGGRRKALAGLALGAAALLVICTRFDIPGPVLFLLSFPLGFCALGLFGLIGPVLAELYPTESRGSGLGFCFNFGRGLAGATPFLVGGGMASLGIGHAISLYACVCYGLVVLAAFLLPETRGRELAAAAL